jgi:hypothetical protein
MATDIVLILLSILLGGLLGLIVEGLKHFYPVYLGLLLLVAANLLGLLEKGLTWHAKK